jgi:hypothetical protein
MTLETHRGCCFLYVKTTKNLCVESLRIIYIGLVKFKDTTAKCRHLKELTRKGTSRKVFICLTPPPPYKLYLQSINSEKHLPESPFTGQFF